MAHLLDDFGAAHGVHFVTLAAGAAGRPLGLPAYDAALADKLEAELEQARTALSALEESAANERLDRVHSQLLSHPHLPQAAWLMAECLSLQAQAARDHDPTLALKLDADRAALEGPRASAFGETTPVPAPAARLTLSIEGLETSDELELDGASLPGNSRRVSVAPGLHHARVWRGGRPIFATFVSVAPEQTTLMLAAPKLRPCSAEDLLGAAEAPEAKPAGVACPRWAKVRSEPGGIGVAFCEHERCGDFVHWVQRTPAPFAPIRVEHQGWPSWAGFALAGAGVLAASSLVLWQAGAFDRGRPTAASWEYGGLNPQTIRF
jgi:hypothetical protein